MAGLALPYSDGEEDDDGPNDERAGGAHAPPREAVTRALYPDEDPAFGGAGGDSACGNDSGGDGDSDEDAYPDTDAQFAREYPSDERGIRCDGDDGAYPDTDAQFGAAAAAAAAEGGARAQPDPPRRAGAGAAAAWAATEAAQPAPPEQPQPGHAPVPQPASTGPPIPCGWAPPAWAQASALLVNAAVEEWAGGVLARAIPLAGRASLIVGRHGGMSDVVLADASVSRAHAAFVCSADGLHVQDLGSAGGTFVSRGAGASVAPIARLGERASVEPLRLGEGDSVRMGDSTHVFRVSGVSTALPERFRSPVWAKLPRARVQLEVADSSKPPNPYLSHLSDGAAAGNELIPIHARVCYVLGRNAQLCDIVVRHESVSRQHCAIVHDEDATFVLDCGSATGTFLSNDDVGAQPRRVSDGQILSLGSSPVTYTFRFGAVGTGAKRRRAE